GLRAGDGGDPHERRRRSAARAEPLALWQRRVGLHRKRRRGALRDGKRERRNGWRERRRPGAARAVQLWRLERIEVRGRRHHRPRLDRVLDEIEEDNNEGKQESGHHRDVVGLSSRAAKTAQRRPPAGIRAYGEAGTVKSARAKPREAFTPKRIRAFAT